MPLTVSKNYLFSSGVISKTDDIFASNPLGSRAVLPISRESGVFMTNSNGKRILVADDEKDIVDIISDQLLSQGYEVESCNSGNDAFRLYQSGHFDAVIADVYMPNGSGLELLKNIQNAGNANGLKFYFSTGVADMDEADAIRLGADGFFAKPFRFSQMVKLIKQDLAKAA
jgi:CheY-like chemotaxis protein